MRTSPIVVIACTLSIASAAADKPQGSASASAILVIVNEHGNPKLTKISFSTLRKIYNCEITNWKDVPGSNRTDTILAYAPDENSELSLFFKRRVGKVTLANCVTTVSGPQANRIIASGLAAMPPDSEAKEVAQGIGILSADLDQLPTGVRALAVSDDNKKPAGSYVTPSPATIRNQSYPLSAKRAQR